RARVGGGSWVPYVAAWARRQRKTSKSCIRPSGSSLGPSSPKARCSGAPRSWVRHARASAHALPDRLPHAGGLLRVRMNKICVLDFGAQYSQLIARRIREMSVYSEIVPCTEPLEKILAQGYQGIVLSGGPSSVYDECAPLPDLPVFEAGVPVLGICYGMQAMGYLLGGEVVPAARREYGPADFLIAGQCGLLRDVTPERDGHIRVWMSHGDTVMKPPPGFVALGSTENCPVAAMADPARKLFGVQFHPEVAHTAQGKTVLRNFLEACGATGDWSMKSFIDSEVAAIRKMVGGDRVLCALSGGVDSSVVAVLLHKA